MDEMKNFMAVTHDGEDVLGKILYYSLSMIMVDRGMLADLCNTMGFPYLPSNRCSLGDAFKSATGDIKDQKTVLSGGEVHRILVYCRDNKRSAEGVLSRELVKETLDTQTNQYEKLANISFDSKSGVFSYDNVAYDSDVDVQGYCQQAEELFALYQRCAGRKQIETLLDHYVAAMQASKLLAHGRVFFIPRTEMARLSLFEDFIAALEEANQYQRPGRSGLSVNSIHVVDDAKQREKMAEAFYATIAKEMEIYQERISNLVQSHCASEKIIDRWVIKIEGLRQKQQTYEQVLQRKLRDMDSSFQTLDYLTQELRLSAGNNGSIGYAA